MLFARTPQVETPGTAAPPEQIAPTPPEPLEIPVDQWKPLVKQYLRPADLAPCAAAGLAMIAAGLERPLWCCVSLTATAVLTLWQNPFHLLDWLPMVTRRCTATAIVAACVGLFLPALKIPVRLCFVACAALVGMVGWIKRDFWAEVEQNRREDADFKAEFTSSSEVNTLAERFANGGTAAAEALEEWERHGCAETRSLLRLSFGWLDDEQQIQTTAKAAYCLAMLHAADRIEEAEQLRAAADERRKKALEIEEENDRLQAEIEALEEALAETKKSRDYFSDLWQKDAEKYIAARDRLLELERRADQTETTTAPDPEPQPEPEAEAGADQQPDYSTLRGDERKAAMTQLKDNGQSYTDIAKLFGVSVGCAKATISQYRKHQQAQAEPETNIIPVDFTDGLPSVSTG